MSVVHRQVGAPRRLASTALVALSALLATACATERSVSAPVLPGDSPVAQFKPMAFIADVNTRTGKITIIDPTRGTQAGPTLSIDGKEIPNLSLLGGEAVRLVPSNYQASAVGANAPNKVRVSFDVNIENKLPGVKFIQPTWPVAPAGAAGVILFPLDYVVTTTPGGTSNTGDGNTIIVEQPSYGGIVPSIDWNGTGAAGSGAPYSFFNDTDCSLATSNDCFRWEDFDAEILPLTGSSARKVGFDIDASVGQFRVRMIVAADLAAAAAVAPGSITGTVTSTLGGGIGNVTVTAGAGLTATTDANGLYTIANVNPGSKTVTLSNLPANCTAPAAGGGTVASGSALTVNFTVTCSGLPGSISGLLTNSVGNTPIAGATITASGGGTTTTSATGTYTLPTVPSGTGTLSVTLPATGFAGCTTPTPAYTLASAGTLTVNITATCPVPLGPGYLYSETWENVSATQVAVTIRIDMARFDAADLPNIDVNGSVSDAINAYQLSLSFPTAKLQYASSTAPTGTANNFGSPTINSIASINSTGIINVNAFDTGGFTGLVGIRRFVFNKVSGATGDVALTSNFSSSGVIFEGTLSSGSPKSLKPDIVKQSPAFTLP